MIINHANLAILNQAYNAAFQSGLTTAAPMWNQLAMLVPSTTSTEKYAWLGSITKFREWLGERTYQNLKQSDYSIKNKTWENTVSVNRDEIEDDQYGVYKPVIQQLGQDAATHPTNLSSRSCRRASPRVASTANISSTRITLSGSPARRSASATSKAARAQPGSWWTRPR